MREQRVPYIQPEMELVNIHLQGFLAQSQPTEPIIKDPEEEI